MDITSTNFPCVTFMVARIALVSTDLKYTYPVLSSRVGFFSVIMLTSILPSPLEGFTVIQSTDVSVYQGTLLFTDTLLLSPFISEPIIVLSVVKVSSKPSWFMVNITSPIELVKVILKTLSLCVGLFGTVTDKVATSPIHKRSVYSKSLSTPT